ncbi:MAG: squalene/phytoene synthase family protein [Steroidobacteraceae bacterium]|jgi:phytoene/squalene synthetase
MGPPLSHLDEPYRSRALPGGSVRYWSWLFAAPESRDPLIGIYALSAEWRALMDPATGLEPARMQLAWWAEEVARLVRGAPLHPITRFLAALPRAAQVDFAALNASLEAVARQIAGAPLERSTELEPQGATLWATPLVTAAHLARDLEGGSEPAVRRAVSALGAAQYLQESVADYRRDALHGRVIFPVDELLAAGIEDEDLTAPSPPPALQAYLDGLRGRAERLFNAAADGLPEVERPALRHLLVLAALGARHSRRDVKRTGAFRPADLYQAWVAARRAVSPDSKH